MSGTLKIPKNSFGCDPVSIIVTGIELVQIAYGVRNVGTSAYSQVHECSNQFAIREFLLIKVWIFTWSFQWCTRAQRYGDAFKFRHSETFKYARNITVLTHRNLVLLSWVNSIPRQYLIGLRSATLKMLDKYFPNSLISSLFCEATMMSST